MTRRGTFPTVTEERLEQAVVKMAYIVLRHGEVYAPLFDRLEAELDLVRRKRSPTERARRALEALQVPRGTKGDLLKPSPLLPQFVP
jgi:hypothetical protein